MTRAFRGLNGYAHMAHIPFSPLKLQSGLCHGRNCIKHKIQLAGVMIDCASARQPMYSLASHIIYKMLVDL